MQQEFEQLDSSFDSVHLVAHYEVPTQIIVPEINECDLDIDRQLQNVSIQSI